jgi:hypothetical protein
VDPATVVNQFCGAVDVRSVPKVAGTCLPVHLVSFRQEDDMKRAERAFNVVTSKGVQVFAIPGDDVAIVEGFLREELQCTPEEKVVQVDKIPPNVGAREWIDFLAGQLDTIIKYLNLVKTGSVQRSIIAFKYGGVVGRVIQKLNGFPFEGGVLEACLCDCDIFE